MTAEVNILPTKDAANRSRLTALLIEGGTQVLRNMVMDLLFEFYIRRKRDDIQEQIGISIYQQQFEFLFPIQEHMPRLHDLDATLLTFVTKVLGISLGHGTCQVPYIKQKILEYLDGEGFCHYLELQRPYLQSLGHQTKSQYHTLYPHVRKNYRMRLSDLDITLLSFILMNAFILKPTSGVWKKMPLEIHTELGDDIIRLREWRNYIFHRTSAKIDNETFKELWKSITALLQRRLGESSSMEIDLLKMASLDANSDDYYKKLKDWCLMDTELKDALRDIETKIDLGNAEMRTMKNDVGLSNQALIASEVENLSKKVDDITNKLQLDTKKHSKHDTTYETSIREYLLTTIKVVQPKLPTDYMRSVVADWEKKDYVFYETKASDTVCDDLNKKNMVTITGAPGSGKKATARHAALGLKETGYHLYPIASPDEITDFFCEALKQVFYVDNPVGELVLDNNELAKWEICSEGIQNLLKKANFKVLVTTSPQMLHVLQNSNVVLTHHVIDITDQSNRLTKKEKYKIFHKHCPSIRQSFKVFNCPFDCFPLLCFIFGQDSEDSKSQNIFERPFHVVQQIFEKLKGRNKYQFYGMLLCAVVDKLHENLLDIFIDDDTMAADRAKINKILIGMGLQAETSYRFVKRELDLICDLYVRNIEGTYLFVHHIFRDAVLYIVGKQSTGFIFQFFPASVIREKVIISSSGDHDDNEQYLIVVPESPNVWNMVRTRLRKDLRNSQYEDAFINKHFSEGSLAKLMLEEIKRMDDKQRQKCDDRGRTMLHWSVARSMITLTTFLLEVGLSVNSVDKHGCSAVFFGYSCEILSILISHHANLNIVNIHGETALLRNLSKGSDLIQMLLDNNADVNLHGKHNDTALVRAANYNDIELVRMLLDYGADVDGRRTDGDTAIVKAAYHNNESMVALLIGHKADVDLHAKYGDTALVHATKHDNVTMAKELLRKSANANLHGEKYEVIEMDRPGMLTLLLEVNVYKLRVDELLSNIDIFRETSIVKAVRKNNLEMMKLLLEHGANPNLNGAGPHSALVKAAYHNNFEITNLLLHHGADVNLKCTGYRYLDTAIVNAAYHNNESMVDLFLGHHADVNFRGQERDAAIVKAAYNNNTKLASILIEKGADVNLHGRYSDSAIVRAVYHNNTEMVRLLLKFGAKPDSCGEISDPAFGKASYKNNSEIMNMLIDNGVDVNKYRFGSNAPISNAVYHRNKGMVEKLLEKGAKVNYQEESIILDGFRSERTDSPQTAALKKILLKFGRNVYIRCKGHDQDIEWFTKDVENRRREIEEEGIQLYNKNRKTALMQAAYSNDLEIVQILLKHNADVNFLSERFDPAIVSAARNDNLEMVKILLHHEADPNVHVHTRDPAIVHAAHRSNMPMLKLLISHGADVNICGESRDSVLVRATGYNNTRMVKYLVAHGCNVNYICFPCHTALLRAAENNNLQLVKLILSKGADVNLSNNCCKNALSEAVNHKNLEMVKLLIDHGADIRNYCVLCDTFLSRAVRFNNLSMVKLLLKCGADVNQCFKERSSLIALAAERNNKQIVKCLLDHGAGVNADPTYLDSALIRAANNNNTEILKLFLDENADVDSCARRRSRHISGSRAKRRSSAVVKAANHNNLEILKRLIDHGANFQQPWHVHENAIVVGVRNSNISIVTLLLEKGMWLHDEVKRKILYEAINRHNMSMVSLLLEHGVSVRLPSKKYHTPLARAIRLRDTEMTVILLCAGAMHAVNNTSATRDTALVNAAYNNDTELVKLLLDLGADTNLHTADTVSENIKRYSGFELLSLDHLNFNPILIFENDSTFSKLGQIIFSVEQIQELINLALYDSDKEPSYAMNVRTMVNQLLYLFPEIHLHDIGNTALGEATFHDNMEMVKMLLTRGAKVNNCGAADTPLVNAVNNNNVAMVKLLIDHGAVLNDPITYHDTAIVRAAYHNSIEIAKILIDKGANVNACGEFTHPALFTAASFNHTNMAELLLEHGADVHYYDGSCDTALSKAIYHQNNHIVKMLLHYGADSDMFSKGKNTNACGISENAAFMS